MAYFCCFSIGGNLDILQKVLEHRLLEQEEEEGPECGHFTFENGNLFAALIMENNH